MSVSGLTITIPPGCDVRLSIIAPHSLVLVAPPGMAADLSMLLPVGVSGVFTFDRGLTWPDRKGCSAATALLANDSPLCFQFDGLADAMAFHKRLIAETVR